MNFLFNGLSVGGQFNNVSDFRVAVGTIMRIRAELRKSGFTLSCGYQLANREIVAGTTLREAVARFPPAERTAFLQWLSRDGPYWEKQREHPAGEWLECDGDVVTDTAVGEAAIRCVKKLDATLVSIEPSSWERNPLVVKWVHDEGSAQSIPIENHWQLPTVRQLLDAKPMPVVSWEELAQWSTSQFQNLTFAGNAFSFMKPVPFSSAACARLRALLTILSEMKNGFSNSGERTAAAHRLYRDHFTGDKGWFSDSSETEKRQFREALKFKHPEGGGELCCSWHGKVKTPQLRVHFSWPITAKDALYIPYVGPKLTKR